MKTLHNILMFIQWVLFVGGILGGGPLLYLGDLTDGFLCLGIGLLALIALKLEAVAFTTPRRD